MTVKTMNSAFVFLQMEHDGGIKNVREYTIKE